VPRCNLHGVGEKILDADPVEPESYPLSIVSRKAYRVLECRENSSTVFTARRTWTHSAVLSVSRCPSSCLWQSQAGVLSKHLGDPAVFQHRLPSPCPTMFCKWIRV